MTIHNLTSSLDFMMLQGSDMQSVMTYEVTCLRYDFNAKCSSQHCYLPSSNSFPMVSYGRKHQAI